MHRYLILAVFFLVNTLRAQTTQFTTWSLEAGLPQSQVYAMCEDLHGYLWIGTQGGGVCRFDGMDFEVFTVQEGLPSNFISALYEDKSGRIWAGTGEGAAVWDGKQFQKVPFETPLTVYSFLQTGTENLLLGTSRGVLQYTFKTRQLSRLSLDKTLDKTPVYCLSYTNENRTVWLGTLQGLWYMPLQTKQAVHFNKKTKLPVAPVSAIAQSGAMLWLAQAGGPLVAVDWAHQTVKSTLTLPPVGSITCLLSDADQSLWAGTQSLGLIHLRPGNDSSITQLTEADGLPHNHLRVLLRDHAGRMWLGTSGGGFACMVAQAFRRYDRDDGLPGNRIYAVHETIYGEIWMAVSQNGLARIDSAGHIHRFAADSSYLEGVKCRTITTDAWGNIWAGTEGKGALVMMPDRWRIFRKDNGTLPSDWVQKIISDAAGVVWLATGQGIVSLKWNDADSTFNKRWYGAREGVPQGTITALQEDRQTNYVWFGTVDGKIGRIKNGNVEMIKTSLPATSITALEFDHAGQCWVGTKGAGIFMANVRKNDPFAPLVTPQPLSSQNIYLLAFDHSDHLWAGTETGVDEIISDQGKVIIVRHFGKQEGFSGIETCQDAALCDRSGRMWFGTMNGLMRYIPNTADRKNSPPLLHFEQVSLFYKPIPETPYMTDAAALFNGTEGGLALPWNQNHLSFSFKGVELMHSDPLQYRWKLEGADTDWSPWSEQTQVNYANLAPGTYKFWIQASSGADALSPAIPAAFTIGKPFWESWYFRLVELALLSAGIFWAVRTYVGIRKEEQRRREQLEMQNRLLQLEQKALQLQMNPHFIFNALNSVQSLIATRDYEVARQEINRFAKLMRSILNNSRKTGITLQEEIETLEQYLSVEQFCQQNPFTFDIRVAENVDAENLDIPPMLLQPFVENAVVHGVSHLTYPGRIDIFFEIAGDMLVCRIVDNGPGREKAALLREAKKPGHQSMALAVTQERLAAIGGALEFHDKEIGTEVEIRLRMEP